MNGYDLFMLPLEKKGLHALRDKYIRQTKGHVLEIGAGTGVNSNYYQDDLHVTITDHKISEVLKDKLKSVSFSYELLSSNVESLSFPDNHFDMVVSTLVFCSVGDVNRGLSELYRVLKPGGKMMFIEHVLPSEQPSRALFNIINPLWKRIASNCHLNRDFLEFVSKTEFQLLSKETIFGTKFVAGILIK